MLIVGAQGHAREILDILLRDRIPKDSILFYDDVNVDTIVVHNYFKVVKNRVQLEEVFKQNPDFCLGLGGPMPRKKLSSLLLGLGGRINSVIGNCILSDYSKIENGVDVLDYAYIGPNVKIGFGTLINTRASIHHDSVVGDFCEISPNATILGFGSVGNYCQLGAGSVVLPKVKIGHGVIVGAGAVVCNDLPDNIVATGVPARVVKINNFSDF